MGRGLMAAMRSQTKLLGSTPWQHVRVTKASTAIRSCWGVLIVSTSVSRRPRLPYEVAGEYFSAARPWRQLCEASCGILAPRQRRHQSPDHVLLSRGLSCLCTVLRSQFCAILRAALLARGSLGRHATALDKKAACASLVRVGTSRYE